MEYKTKITNLSIVYACFSIGILLMIFLLYSHLFISLIIQPHVLEFFVIILYFLLFFVTINLFSVTQKIKIVSIIFFTLKIMFIYIFSQYNNLIIFNDSYNYIRTLDSIINANNYSFATIQNLAGTLHVGHYYFMLVPYLLFETTFSIVMTNVLITSVSLIIFYKTFEIDFGKKIAFITFVIASLSANIFLFGSGILKDPIVLFFTAIIIYGIKSKRINLLLIIGLILFLFTIRIYAGFSMLLVLIYQLFFLQNKLNSKKKKYFAIATLIASLFIVLRNSSAQAYFKLSFSYASNFLSIDTLLVFPKSIIKFFFSPLPWNSLTDLTLYSILSLDSTFFIIFSFSLVLFVLKYLNHKELRLKFNYYLLPILVHAIVLGYAYDGDSARQRIGIFIFLILIVVLGIFYKNNNKKALD